MLASAGWGSVYALGQAPGIPRYRLGFVRLGKLGFGLALMSAHEPLLIVRGANKR